MRLAILLLIVAGVSVALAQDPRLSGLRRDPPPCLEPIQSWELNTAPQRLGVWDVRLSHEDVASLRRAAEALSRELEETAAQRHLRLSALPRGGVLNVEILGRGAPPAATIEIRAESGELLLASVGTFRDRRITTGSYNPFDPAAPPPFEALDSEWRLGIPGLLPRRIVVRVMTPDRSFRVEYQVTVSTLRQAPVPEPPM